MNIENFNFDNNFKSYPNPFTNLLYIELDNPIDKIEIYDISLKKIYDKNVNSKFLEINTSFLTQGVYILKIISAKKGLLKKIIKI